MDAKLHITFDIDWAPDWIIGDLLDLLDQNQVLATFFITHESDTIKDIDGRGHKIGIHPNFFKNSTQGNNPLEIVENLLKLAPDADTFRTHGLYQSSQLLTEVVTAFPQLQYDLSLCMYKFPQVALHNYAYETASFQRINYDWEDDFAFFDKEFDWNTFQPWSNIHVLDFHPIHIALNSCGMANYRALQAEINHGLTSLGRDTLSKFINSKPGTQTIFMDVLSSHRTISYKELLCALES